MGWYFGFCVFVDVHQINKPIGNPAKATITATGKSIPESPMEMVFVKVSHPSTSMHSKGPVVGMIVAMYLSVCVIK